MTSTVTSTERETELCAALSAYREADASDLSDAALLDEVLVLLAARDALDGLLARRIELADARDATVSEAGYGTKTFLVVEGRCSSHEAGQRVFVARSLAVAPRLAAAVEEGAVGHDSARLVASTLRELAPEHRGSAEQILVELARQTPPAQVAAAGREIVHRTFSRERREAAEQRRLANRHLSIASTFGGMVSVSGMLDPENGEALKVALDSLSQRAGADDDRTIAQRRADALGSLARHALGCSGLPDTGGERPQLTLTLDYEQLRAQVGRAVLPGTELPVDADALRRLACDAAVIPAVLGSDSAVLDIGRTTRIWPAGIRRAARLRDGGCTFPGCPAGLERCDLHHIEHWADGGDTSLLNSAHVCTFHHRLIHERGWTLRRTGPSSVRFTRPDGSAAHDPPHARAG